jgi:Protein of unknown function (DUF1697)
VPVWVCLLCGVNPGKQRQLPMPALRAVLTAAGMTDVRNPPAAVGDVLQVQPQYLARARGLFSQSAQGAVHGHARGPGR